MNERILVVGMGYVGASIAAVLAKRFEVICLDIDHEKVKKINNHQSPITESEVINFFKNEKLRIKAYKDINELDDIPSKVIICLPTNFDEKNSAFNLSSIECFLREINEINNLDVVIKSTLPVGASDKLAKKFINLNIIYSPEFLREGSSISDNLRPSRIVLGGDETASKRFLDVLTQILDKKYCKAIFSTRTEAEIIKLASNSYLAMRVAFFNEIDSLCLSKEISSDKVIEGISYDPRIGDHYCNPSFGYGGYCLPKDTKQLKEDFKDLNENLISAIIESNKTRKEFLAKIIMQDQPKSIGIFRLQMKKGSDNFRNSAVIDIINLIKSENIELKIFEPLIKENYWLDIKVEKNFSTFKQNSDIIIANRYSAELNDFQGKIFTRDLDLK